MAFPPHSTHRLQPLDVSLFNPLASFYSQNLDAWLRKSHGICSMNKRHFWGLFQPAFESAFTKKNVMSGWRKTGLYPLNVEVVLSQLRSPDSRPSSSSTSGASAFSSSSWKRASKHYRSTYGPPQTRDEKKQLNTIHHLFAKAQHQELEIELLKERLQLQEKQNKRSLTLFNELRASDDNKAIFFSPKKVQEARDLHAQREFEKEQEAERKQSEKLTREQTKALKALQQAEKRLQVQQQREQRQQEQAKMRLKREEEKRRKQAEKQLQTESKLAKQQPNHSQSKSVRFESIMIADTDGQDDSIPTPVSTRSRAKRRLPQRYRI
jgi:hypothetical protein